ATSATNFVINPLPAISTFSPVSGLVGTSVSIAGTNLGGTTSVRFNGSAAAFAVASNTQIVATVPIAATTGPISITTAAGTATTVANFVVNALPSISTFSPASGPSGTSVSINGMNLSGT